MRLMGSGWGIGGGRVYLVLSVLGDFFAGVLRSLRVSESSSLSMASGC